MARPKNKKLKKQMSKKQLNKKNKEIRRINEVLYKLHFIKHLYNDISIK